MIVSRFNVSQRFIDSIPKSPTIATLARVLVDGVPSDTAIPIEDGSVAKDAQAAVRGSADVTIKSGGLVPVLPADLLAPYGNEIQLARGIHYSDGTEELVSLGIFRINETDVVDSGDDFSIRLNCQDRSAKVADAKFEEPYQITDGTLATDAILALVEPSYPDLQYEFGAAPIPLPAVIAEEGDDRWNMAQEIAQAIGGQLYFNSDGILVLKPVPTAAAEASIADFIEGENSVLVSVEKNWSRVDATNRVIVTGENTATLPVRGVATDDDPTSPTYYYGPFGQAPSFETSEYVTTAVQAEDMARGILAAKLGTTQQVSFGTIVDPRLGPDDVVTIRRLRAGVDEVHVIDTLDIPLAVDGVMSGTTRSVVV